MKVRIKIDSRKNPGQRVALNVFLIQYFNKFYNDLNEAISGYRSIQEHANRDKIIQFISGKISDFDLLRLLLRGAFLLHDIDLLQLKQLDMTEQNMRIKDIGHFIKKVEENMRMSFVPIPNINHALQTYLNLNNLLIRGIEGYFTISKEKNTTDIEKNSNENFKNNISYNSTIDFSEMNRIIKIYLLKEDVENYTVSGGMLHLSSQKFNSEIVLCGLYSNPVWKIVKINSAINSRSLEIAVMQCMDKSLEKLVKFFEFHDNRITTLSSLITIEPSVPNLKDNNKFNRYYRINNLILEFDRTGFAFSIIHNKIDCLQKITRVELNESNQSFFLNKFSNNIEIDNNNTKKEINKNITRLFGWYNINSEYGCQNKTSIIPSNSLNKNCFHLIPTFIDEHIFLFECFLEITAFISEIRLDNFIITRYFMIKVFFTDSNQIKCNNNISNNNNIKSIIESHSNYLNIFYKLIYPKNPKNSFSFFDLFTDSDSESINLDFFDTFSSSNLNDILRRAELVVLQHNIPEPFKVIENIPNEKLVLEIPGLKLLFTDSFKSTLRFLTEDCISFSFAISLTYTLNFNKFYLCSFLPLLSTGNTLIFDYDELLGENITITYTSTGYRIASQTARKALGVPHFFTIKDESVFSKLFRAFIVNRFYTIKRILNISTTSKNTLLLLNNHSIVMTGEGLKYYDSENNLVSEITRILNTERLIKTALKTAGLIQG